MPLRGGDPSRIGRFKVTARLGAGGMGVVYLGTAKDGTRVAVKVLRSELGDDADFRVRFRREVAMITRVQGLCTVRVIEADMDSATPYLVTEYADGPSLAEYLTAHGPLGPELLHGLATGLAEALTAIHAAGVIHRDLKPANVLLTPSGPKVIDFGIAQALDSTAVTRTGMSVGTPGFMAPEQITGQAGPPADIFAWGLTVAYAATGQSPFGTGPTDAILYRILHDTPNVSAIPDPLRPLVEQALAKDPAQRPAAPALLAHLAMLAGHPNDPAQAPTQLVLSRTWLLPAGAIPGTGSRHATLPVTLPWRRFAVAVAVALVIAAATGAAAAYLTSRPAHLAGARSVVPGATRPSVTTSPSAPGQSVSGKPDPATPAVQPGPTTDELIATLTGPGNGSVSSLAFGPDGSLAVGDLSTYLWNTSTRKITATIPDRDGNGTFQVAFGPNDTLAVLDDSPNAYLWNAASGSLITTLSATDGGTLESVAFGPSGVLAAGDSSTGLNGSIFLWNTTTWKIIGTLTTTGFNAPTTMAFGPDGIIAAGCDVQASANPNTYLWNAATGQLVGTVSDPGGTGVQSLAFGPDGTLAVADSNGNTYLWNTATRSLIATLTPQGGPPVSVAFSPDGTLAVGQGNGKTVLWNTATRAVMATLADPDGQTVESVAFASDGTLAVGDSNGKTYLWLITGGKS